MLFSWEVPNTHSCVCGKSLRLTYRTNHSYHCHWCHMDFGKSTDISNMAKGYVKEYFDPILVFFPITLVLHCPQLMQGYVKEYFDPILVFFPNNTGLTLSLINVSVHNINYLHNSTSPYSEVYTAWLHCRWYEIFLPSSVEESMLAHNSSLLLYKPGVEVCSHVDPFVPEELPW